jgi:hypothetical protein
MLVFYIDDAFPGLEGGWEKEFAKGAWEMEIESGVGLGGSGA